MRTDKKKNLSKVAAEYLKDPLATEREIAERAGVGNGTAHNLSKELEQIGAKDDDIKLICEKDKENVMLGQAILNKRLQEQSEKLKTSDIVQIMNEGTKRYTLFKGDMTDDEGGLKKIEGINIVIE